MAVNRIQIDGTRRVKGIEGISLGAGRTLLSTASRVYTSVLHNELRERSADAKTIAELKDMLLTAAEGERDDGRKLAVVLGTVPGRSTLGIDSWTFTEIGTAALQATVTTSAQLLSKTFPSPEVVARLALPTSVEYDDVMGKLVKMATDVYVISGTRITGTGKRGVDIDLPTGAKVHDVTHFPAVRRAVTEAKKLMAEAEASA